jgi:hypothetical protein
VIFPVNIRAVTTVVNVNVAVTPIHYICIVSWSKFVANEVNRMDYGVAYQVSYKQ